MSIKGSIKDKLLAIVMAVVMTFGVAPVNLFAADQVVQKVVSINTDNLKTSCEVPVGTKKSDLELPSKLEVQVEKASADETAETETVKATANVNWEGEYNSDKVGKYVLTAAFADSQYVYSGKMPSISVNVVENEVPKTVAPAPEKTAKSETRTYSATAPAKAARQTSPLAAGDPETRIMINLIDIDAIVSSLFEVKPSGASNFQQLPLPDGQILHIGDEVHIKFKYSELTDVQSNNVYYFNIPSGLSAIAGESRGDIKSDDNQTIGSYWIEDGKIMMQFTNEEYLNDNDHIISEGFVNFYGTLNQDAVDHEGEIYLGGQFLGKLPIEPDDDITNVNVKKWNGTKESGTAGLVYDADRNAVQYTIAIDTNGNNKKVDKIDVVDTLTTTVNDKEESDIATGTYDEIKITPADSGATFTKGSDGKYVLHAENVEPNKTITVTYWVPLREGVLKAKFVNDVDGTKTVGDTTQRVGGDSVSGEISNSLDINKKASKPAFDPDTATTTVTYTVTVTAPETNKTDIPDAYVQDTFTINGEFVKSVDKVSGDGTFGSLTTGKNANFKVELGTMAPGTTKTYTYKATLDTDLCYFYNAPGSKWFDNWAETKSGDVSFDKSKASLKFEKQFTQKKATYDSTTGKFKFVLFFDGTIPGTDNQYYDKVLKSFSDLISSGNSTYCGTPAPVLEAMKGDSVEKTAELDGSKIDGKTSFDLDIPANMQGEYSYRLTYYVNMPEGTAQADTVKNTFAVSVGIGPGGQPVTFESTASVSAASAANNAMSKSVDVERGTEDSEGSNEFATNKFYISIKSPVVEGATLTDWTEKTAGAMVDFKMPLDFLKEKMTIKYAGRNLVEGEDYKIEAVGNDDEQFKITFLKAFPAVSDTNSISIEYLAQVVASEDGKEMAKNPDGGRIGNEKEIFNYAKFENGGLTSEKKAKVDEGGYIEKKVVNTADMDVDSNLIGWDIVITNGYFDAFGTGYHPLVDTIPANQELVKVEQFMDNGTPKECSTNGTAEHGYTSVVNEDGTTTVTINAYTGCRNHPQTYRVWTRIKDSALIDENIDPDNFDNLEFKNSAYYETVGTKWNVAASTEVSRHNNEKTYKYNAGTEDKGGIEFTLDINKEGLDMDPKMDTITIHDTMNKQLVLVRDSLKINGKAVEDIPGAKLTYQEGSNKFDLVIPDGMACKITYIANIDAEVGEAGWLENTATIDGRIGTVSTESLDTVRLDLSAGSTAMYSFYIKKVDKDGALLKGAEFLLNRVKAVDGELTETAMETATNPGGVSFDFGDGTYKYRGVKKTENGYSCVYTLQETKAPTGCEKDSTVHYIAFGTNIDPAVKAALDAKNITIETAHTGQANNLDSMFKIKNDDATMSIPVTKVWDDSSNFDNVRPSSIAIKLLADNEVIKTQNVTGEGNTWNYTFTDLPTHKTLDDGTRQAITYSIDEVSVTGYETIVSGSAENGYTITNKHDVPLETSQVFTGKKLLTEDGQNKTITAGQFKFTVEADDSNPMAIGGLPTGEMSVLADGTFSLGTLTFSKAGTYKFTVSEVNGGAAGYTYDSVPVTVTVPVTVNTETNTLVIGNASYTKGNRTVDGIVFENTYTTPDGAEKEFTGSKTLTENGNKKDIKAGQFKFVAQASDDNPAAIGGFPTGEISVDANGGFSLGTLTFSKTGTYTFTVSEVNSGAAGYTYDDKAVTVTVPVTLDEASNSLVVGNATYNKDGNPVDGISFANTYTTPEDANAVFSGKKTLTENGEDKEITAGQFKFTVEESDSNPAQIVGLPTGEMSVGADGSFGLGTLSFTQVGDYTFTVSEVNSGATGYTYDDEPVTVTVPVVLNTQNNKLEIGDVSYSKAGEEVDGIEFANTYETPEPASQEFSAVKTLTENGEAKEIQDGQFKFVVQEDENNPTNIDGLPTEEVAVDADGNIGLGKLAFAKAGKYIFTVSEVNGGAAGYTYDDKAVTVTVSVVLNTDTNKLEIEDVSYEKDGDAAEGIAFANTYETPDAATVKLTGKKILTEKGKEIAVKAGQFKFTVKESDDNPAKIAGINKDEIPVKADGSIQLYRMNFSKVGTYKFTVSEKNEGLKNYTYDNKPVTVTAQVVLNTDTNKLEVESVTYNKDGKDVRGIEFLNTYKAPTKVTKHKPEQPKKTTKSGKPSTGDSAFILLPIILLLLSSAGIYIVIRLRKKEQ